MDGQSVIEYCINEISGSNRNKLILYACKNISEFKEKLKVWEKLFNVQNKSLPHLNSFDNKRTNVRHSNVPSDNKNVTNFDYKFKNTGEFNTKLDKNEKSIRCYNCGLFNHKCSDCFHKTKVSNVFDAIILDIKALIHSLTNTKLKLTL